MTTKEQMLEYAAHEKERHEGAIPIYEIMMVEYPDKELMLANKKPSGWPDTGASFTAGFYYDLDDAVEAVENNACDIRECLYNGAFILMRFPGLYNSVDSTNRMYFVWEDDKYVQKDEPKIFAHIVY